VNSDPFYTPTDIANKLVGYSTQETPRCVADFCAGRGELLRVARQRWPQAMLVGLELNKANIATLRANAIAQTVIHCDFLHPCVRHIRVLKALQGRVSVALLNPPFSHRGGTKCTVSVGDKQLTCSPAMEFVLRAFEFLSRDGEIVAILPAGCLRTEKDELAWRYLRTHAQTSVLGSNGHRTFQDCVVHTLLVRIRKCSGQPAEPAKVTRCQQRTDAESVELFRGKIPMYTVGSRKGRAYFVHTTELKNGAVTPVRKISVSEFGISGPLVLVSRVGQPSIGKLAIYSGTEKVVLSDCVLALRCKSLSAAKKLHVHLLKSWKQLRASYGGTGAPFLTVRTLSTFLQNRGYAVRAFSASEKCRHKLVRAIEAVSAGSGAGTNGISRK